MKANPSAPGLASGEPGARFERRGAAGLILLERPKALDALTPAMARGVAEALDSFVRGRRQLATPEVGVGFFPDVGAAFAPLGAREFTFPETPR
jgi:enoyl-CoA hydratase/carnithine racemase